MKVPKPGQYLSKAAQITTDSGVMLDRILTFFERNPAALDWVILAGALGGAAAIPIIDAALQKAKQGTTPPFPSPTEQWTWGDVISEGIVRSPMGFLAFLFDPTKRIPLPNVAGVAISGGFITVAGIAAARLLLNTEGAAGALSQVGGAIGSVAGKI